MQKERKHGGLIDIDRLLSVRTKGQRKRERKKGLRGQEDRKQEKWKTKKNELFQQRAACLLSGLGCHGHDELPLGAAMFHATYPSRRRRRIGQAGGRAGISRSAPSPAAPLPVDDLPTLSEPNRRSGNDFDLSAASFETARRRRWTTAASQKQWFGRQQQCPHVMRRPVSSPGKQDMDGDHRARCGAEVLYCRYPGHGTLNTRTHTNGCYRLDFPMPARSLPGRKKKSKALICNV